MANQRRGMLIKNTNDRSVDVEMATRSIHLDPGDEAFITAEEVRDADLRAKLQVRAIAIVRPSTPDEDATLQRELTGEPTPASPGDAADPAPSATS